MKLLLIALGIALAVVGATGWLAIGAEPVTTDRIGDQNQTLPRGQLPVFAGDADTKALYRFAVDNPNTLTFMPCTCGCGDPSIGHTSNRSCYVKDEAQGRVTFTSHAAT